MAREFLRTHCALEIPTSMALLFQTHSRKASTKYFRNAICFATNNQLSSDCTTSPVINRGTFRERGWIRLK